MTLDGLIITSGNALAEEIPNNVIDRRPYRGAADIRGNAIVRNCTFEQSIANAGGGLFVVPVCIDAGNPNNVNFTLDLAGEARVQGSQIDIGAYESGFSVGFADLHKNKVSV